MYNIENVSYDYRSWRHSALCLLAPAEGWGAPPGAFGSLYSSRSCLTKHTQLSVQISLNNIFGGIMLNFHISVLLPLQ